MTMTAEETIHQFTRAVAGESMPSPCWLWERGCTRDGYGVLWIKGKGADRVHRLSYRTFVGRIPEGYEIDHLCRNRACCNPAHLEAVPKKVNILRGFGTGAKFARRTHCLNGHEFTKENTRIEKSIYGTDSRRCRECDRTYTRLKMRRLRAKKAIGT